MKSGFLNILTLPNFTDSDFKEKANNLSLGNLIYEISDFEYSNLVSFDYLQCVTERVWPRCVVDILSDL